MIKDFPEFGELELSDKNEISELTKDFLRYSDFSFSNMWAWDVAVSKRGFSRLNGNLVIRLFNYKTNEPSFSICGDKMPNETVEAVLALARKESIMSPLKLIPEELAEKITLPSAEVIEDRDNFDYIYLVDELEAFEGGKFKQKRNEINGLLTAYPGIEVRELDIKDPLIKKEISCLFHRWEKNKTAKGDDFESNEISAFSNLLILSEMSDLLLIGMYLENKMVAFIISEIRNREYAVGHFAKTESSVRGANAYLLQSLAKMLSTRDIKYFNYEQDMGLPNLRDAKMRFRPAAMLKKYIVRRKE